jgi:hypothetical protein
MSHAVGGVYVPMPGNLAWTSLAITASVAQPGRDAALDAMPSVGLPHPLVLTGGLGPVPAGFCAGMLFEELRHGVLCFNLAKVMTDLAKVCFFGLWSP